MLPRPVVPPSPSPPAPAERGHPAPAGPAGPADHDFWGPDTHGWGAGVPGAWIDRLARWRRDPRAGVALLVVAAVVAGLVWYRIGSRSVGPAPGYAAGASGAASTPRPGEGAGSPGGEPGAAGSGAPASVATSGGPTAAKRTRPLVVHVAGAVVRPGVVELPPGSRVIDAVEAAGGARPEADLDRLNLAALLADGQRVAVAKAGEPPPVLDSAAAGTGTGASAGGSAGSGGPLDLNTATQQQLEELPGVGPVLARSIISERERRGGFRRVEDLRSVRGIGDQRFSDLKPLVTV